MTVREQPKCPKCGSDQTGFLKERIYDRETKYRCKTCKHEFWSKY